MLEVPWQVELESGRAEEAAVPAAEVGHGDGQQPARPQPTSSRRLGPRFHTFRRRALRVLRV
jgi:hypothetical protein